MPDAPTRAQLTETAGPTAAFKVEVNGIEITQREAKGLESFVVEVHLDKIGRAEFIFSGDEALKPGDVDIGQEVKVTVGGTTDTIFEGKITHLGHLHEGGVDTFRIVAMDDLIKLAASNETLVYEEMTDSDIASQVIGSGGATTGTVDATSGTRPYVLQRAESNLRFLKRLAARNGYLVYVTEGKVNFAKPQFSDDAVKVGPGDLIALESVRSDIGIPQNVKVVGWDYVAKEKVEGEFSASGIDQIGGGGTPALQTYAADYHVVDVFVNTADAANGIAEATMNQMARQFVQGKVKVRMIGELYPGKKIEFEGGYSGFDANAFVVGVRHVVESGGVATTTAWFVGNTKPA